MKKILLLLAASFILSSCSSSEDPIPPEDPITAFYEIAVNEKKVVEFNIVFEGIYSIKYDLYEVTYYGTYQDYEVGDLISSGTIEVAGVKNITLNHGSVMFDYKVENIQEEGNLSLHLNESFEHIPYWFVDELNTDHSFLIPYKYKIE